MPGLPSYLSQLLASTLRGMQGDSIPTNYVTTVCAGFFSLPSISQYNNLSKKNQNQDRQVQ